MSEYFQGKIRVHPWIDIHLVDLMKTHVCSIDMNQQDFIAEAIADKLGVPLNANHMLDESYYIELEINKLQNCIDKLTEKKET